jgi:hypothetical protein
MFPMYAICVSCAGLAPRHTTRFAWLLPLDRLLYVSAFSHSFHATGVLLIMVAWLGGLMAAAFLGLRHTVASPA